MWFPGGHDTKTRRELAVALRQARLDALEEAAALCDVWSEAIWCDGEDALLQSLSGDIRALKDKT
jgi:hypothetical protein